VINANSIDYNIKASVGELDQELKLSIETVEKACLIKKFFMRVCL
jgi:hypothetical protein